MASTVSPPPQPPINRRLSIDSLQTIDLHLLSQSELTALSLSSADTADLRRCDDIVIPKIDRSVFNESAGSRKQTFSRLRLAPRNTLHLNEKPRASLSPLDSDNSRIIALFKTLFNNNNVFTTTTTTMDELVEVEDASLVPVNVEYSDVFFDVRESSGKPGRLLRAADEEEMEREREKELVNRNGEVVDLKVLGKAEDPYGEEIRRRTEGKGSSEELLGFISGLDGEWGSRRKKRKIVDANVFGDSLPNGWKLLIAMKKKQGRAWVFCRRYIRFSSLLSSCLSCFFPCFSKCYVVLSFSLRKMV